MKHCFMNSASVNGFCAFASIKAILKLAIVMHSLSVKWRFIDLRWCCTFFFSCSRKLCLVSLPTGYFTAISLCFESKWREMFDFLFPLRTSLHKRQIVCVPSSYGVIKYSASHSVWKVLYSLSRLATFAFGSLCSDFDWLLFLASAPGCCGICPPRFTKNFSICSVKWIINVNLK